MTDDDLKELKMLHNLNGWNWGERQSAVDEIDRLRKLVDDIARSNTNSANIATVPLVSVPPAPWTLTARFHKPQS